MLEFVRQAWRDDTHVETVSAAPTRDVPLATAGTAPARVPVDDAGRRDEAAAAVLALRRAIGALALALPLLVTAVDLFLPDVDWHLRDSLSAYYFAGSREVFTGGLVAAGALLVAFKAFDRRLEFWLTFGAGLLAVLVAFFPTKACADCDAGTPLQEAIGADVVRGVHYASAFAMIGLLAVVCILWAALERHTGLGGERFRALHIASAVVIGVAVCFGIVMVATGPLFDQELLVVEWVSVWAFAVSWLFVGPAYQAREAARAAAGR